jgi:hypothetical protein
MVMRGVVVVLAFLVSFSVGAGEWIRAGVDTNAMTWGRARGLMFAVPPAGFHPPEPRGLIRLGYPVLSNNSYDLINFIAIEPVVNGRKGFSELEPSELDGRRGKRLTVVPAERADLTAGAANQIYAGEISTVTPGVEELTVKIHVERFENGAEMILEIRQRSDAPDEITFTVRAAPGSAPMEFCVLTATMGNRTRARELWLRDETVNSRELYRDYKGSDFAPHTDYPLDRLQRLPNGGVIVAMTGDEDNPAAAKAFPDAPDHFWNYKGVRVTQYWKIAAGPNAAGSEVRLPTDLMAVVNARYVYWGSRQPIAHGISFENFELREPFQDGQRFTFGITRRTPRELGFGSR